MGLKMLFSEWQQIADLCTSFRNNTKWQKICNVIFENATPHIWRRIFIKEKDLLKNDPKTRICRQFLEYHIPYVTQLGN